jgi:hypothetical protein
MDHKTRGARVSEREANASKLSELSFNAGFFCIRRWMPARETFRS